ncbi:MAG: acetyl-CoA carboxylase biotin carboxyl carrier protein [candidate division Zixibacteria bacterium]|nr:acetyl-CoA carboxylase biotin carboxyl carrier protein [candidate division Zixibacteria bacterium]
MREKVIRRLIKIVEESNIESLEYKNWAGSIRIIKKLANGSNGAGAANNLTTYPAGQPGAPASVSSPFVSAPPAEDKLVPIKSPMVGTFYRAPAPDAKPYVEVGDVVEPGQVVCIIEAMKLMNEIESEVKGKIVKIPAESGKPVEFGQALFLIEPL